MRNLAGVLEQSGDLDTAKTLNERVLEIRERALGLDSPQLARSLAILGKLHLELGDPAAAEPLLRRALALGRRQEPHRHPEIIWPRIHLGRCLTLLRRFAEAEATLLITANEADIDPFPRRRTHMLLVELYEAWKRPQEAARYRQELDE